MGISARISREYSDEHHLEICAYVRREAGHFERLTAAYLENSLEKNEKIGRPYRYLHASDALCYGRDMDGMPHHKGGTEITERAYLWINANLHTLREWVPDGKLPGRKK